MSKNNLGFDSIKRKSVSAPVAWLNFVLKLGLFPQLRYVRSSSMHTISLSDSSLFNKKHSEAYFWFYFDPQAFREFENRRKGILRYLLASEYFIDAFHLSTKMRGSFEGEYSWSCQRSTGWLLSYIVIIYDRSKKYNTNYKSENVGTVAKKFIVTDTGFSKKVISGFECEIKLKFFYIKNEF